MHERLGKARIYGTAVALTLVLLSLVWRLLR